MNTPHQHPKDNNETGGQEIERTHENYEKGTPAPGTFHAGQEGKEAIAHTDNQSHTHKEDQDEKSISRDQDAGVLPTGR